MRTEVSGDSDTQPRAARVTAATFLNKEVYFCSQIYYVDVVNCGALNEVLKPHIYTRRLQDPEGVSRSNARAAGSWHSDTHLDEADDFAAVASAVRDLATRVFADLGYDTGYAPVLGGMWANINPRHGFNRSHIHPNALWSGVYYVQAPAASGRIVFKDPRAQAQMLLPHFQDGARRKELWSEVYFEPIEGRLILFPAWLPHEVEPNLSMLDGPAGDRISISFNLRQERIAGPAPDASPR